MKVLNLMESKQVAGGLEAIGVLTALTCLNIGFTIYNYSQIDKIKSTMSYDENLLDLVSILTLYHEAQLSQLPHYDELSTLSVNEAAAFVQKI